MARPLVQPPSFAKPGKDRAPRAGGWLPGPLALLAGALALAAAACTSGGSFQPVGASANNASDGGDSCVGPLCPGACAAHPVTGCACAVEGQHLLCGKVETTYPAQGESPGATVCGSGFSVCSGGHWGECQISGAVMLVPDAPPGYYAEGLGAGTSCVANPCDPACIDLKDTPGGLDAGTGLTSSDGGVTLTGDAGASCVPKTCATLGFNCGTQSDGCGNVLDCGTCAFPQTCGGGGTPSVCGGSGACTNLCLHQTKCAGSGTTSISGTAYMPNGVTPLPNVMVYVPNAALSPFTAQVACVTGGNCTAEVSGSPLVATTSATDGSFTLKGVPAGVSFPVVIQLGRFRRQFTMAAVPACTNAVVPCTTPASCLSRFARSQNETSANDNIPKMAFMTGCVDALECVWQKVGINGTGAPGLGGTNYNTGEFTPGLSSGRINFYMGGGCPGTYVGNSTPWDTALMGTPATMNQYDMLLFPCQGAQYYYPSQVQYQTNIANFVNAGGRVFATHFSYIWLITNPGFGYGPYTSPLSAAINWNINASYSGADPATAYINTGFPGGSTLSSWLSLPAVSASPGPGEMVINTIRHDFDSVNAPTQLWVSLGPAACVNTTGDAANCGGCGVACPSGKVCSAGACTTACAAGLTSCSGSCVNKATDPRNCGSCGHACAAGQTCAAGSCTCAGSSTDPGNCGTCGNVCGAGQTCAAGSCTCQTGYVACGSSCVSTVTDPANCGACGNACATGQTCTGGACACQSGLVKCGSACVNTGTSAANCGGCGIACVNGQACTAGVCSCPTGFTACSSGCASLSADPGNCGACGTVCGPGQTCSSGACTCASGFTRCGAACVDTARSPSNCGGCGIACAGGKVCNAGACACPTGHTTVCGGVCTSTVSDPKNCGACGTVCTGSQKCRNSVCSTSSCTGANPNNCSSACVNTSTDVENCGSCGNVCGAGGTCTSGSCSSCGTGYMLCSGVCVSTSDPSNCGSCGKACGNGQTCSGGACSCPTGYSVCGSSCVNKATDPNNCGACGTVCGPGQTCSSGTCSCPSGFTKCGTACASTGGDPQNCGSCSTACGKDQICSGGACVCPTGFTKCGASCASTATDPLNCGACGTACGIGQTCSGGACTCQSGYTPCGGSCVDLTRDAGNCGSCGDACPSGGTCAAGVCSCSSGTVCGAGIPQQASFNTPLGSAANAQCGRVVYSDFHVESSNNSNYPFPSECSGGSFSPQELMLAQALFDLAGCVTASTAMPCVPVDCSFLGLNCGTAGDGCGGTLSCGSCAAPTTCGGGGQIGVCGVTQSYGAGDFIRDYDASKACPSGQRPVWRLYSWSAVTPKDSHIDFSIATATTFAGLAAATTHPLEWSAPPGVPAGYSAGQAATSHAVGQPAGTADTQLGGASPDTTLAVDLLDQNDPYLRVVAHLVPSSDKYSTPVLSSWDMQIDCVEGQ